MLRLRKSSVFFRLLPAAGFAACTAEEISFNHDVQPILSEYCYSCHGFDPSSRFPKDNPLRLDREEFAFAPRENGKPVIVKGDPAASAIIDRIRSADPEQVMPPPEFHKTVPPEAVAVLETWIEQGAEYEEHWAFIAPAKPEPPAAKNDPWVRTPVDAFILDRLRREKLEPGDEAAARRLIRRVTLDLTGLLPEPADVEAFAADSSEQAYLAHVDKLLASPAFGEHRARHWLDYARYSDTHGKHFDNARSIWPWRDYVIRSINANKPFDRFVREQLAGDRLPDGGLDALIATGYIRNAVTTNEGGTIPEEVHVDQTRDRTEAFGAAFLGLTVGCAACHDHKFDPVTQADFYSLSAFFHNTTERPWDSNIDTPAPILRIPPADRIGEAERTAREISALRHRLAERKKSAAALLDTLIAENTGPQPVSPAALDIRLRCDEGSGDTLANTAPGRSDTFKADTNPLIWREDTWLWPSMRMDINSRLVLGDEGDFESGQPFTAAAWTKLRLKPANIGTGNGSIVSRMGDMSRMGHRGWDLFVDGDKLVVHIVHQWPQHTIRIESPGFPRGQWAHVAMSYDGSSKAAGVKLYVNGREAPVNVTHDTLEPGQTIRTDAPMHLGRREDTQPVRETSYQDFRLYRRALSPDEIARLPFEDPAAEILAAKSRHQWNDDERFLVLDHWLHGQADHEAADLHRQLAEAEAHLAELGKDGPATLIALEKPTPAYAHVLGRGVYTELGERVGPAVPHFLSQLPPGADRLALADWLLSAENPLFARVTVNRIWQELFGTGLVDTPDDFGIMGARPTHPELLDWLAVDFRESGWNLKRFYRELVRSAAYRQSERITPEKLEADPANRLLSRGPRFRMDAEVLRDTALQSSRLLVDRIGGPPVKPYQPGGLWEAVSMPESNTFTYKQQNGEALYRRSLYSFWKRFAPPPSLETFDAPAREVVCARRPRSNTPLQALVLMNDPQFVEASRKLAERLLREESDDARRIDHLATILLARPATEAEAETLAARLRQYRDHFHSHPDSAAALLKTGEAPADPALDPAETAAWTLLSSQIMNLDEFLNR